MLCLPLPPDITNHDGVFSQGKVQRDDRPFFAEAGADLNPFHGLPDTDTGIPGLPGPLPLYSLSGCRRR